MFLQNFIEIGALEPKIRRFIARSFWNYLRGYYGNLFSKNRNFFFAVSVTLNPKV